MVIDMASPSWEPWVREAKRTCSRSVCDKMLSFCSMHACERSQLLSFEGDNASREIRRAEVFTQEGAEYEETVIFGRCYIQKSRGNSMAEGRSQTQKPYPGGHVDPGALA